MPNVVVIGAQWGDEGKAKITDLFAENADLVVRYQGGCNAGHTVVLNNVEYKFHLVPSGILYKGKTCIIGNGTVINPEVLYNEINGLKEKGIDTSNLCISPIAHLTLPYHIDIDGSSEKASGKNKIGTTKRGIGPTYADKINRIGIRIEDLFDEETLNEKLDNILPRKNAELVDLYGLKPYTKETILEFCRKYAKLLKPYVKDTYEIIHSAIKDNKKILFEGAQGVMLDIDHGTYPYVTSSNPIAGGACAGAGVGPSNIHNAVGVSKAYITRVGEGPFVTELLDEVGETIQKVGHEFGTTTGRSRRCGWFDVVVAKHASRLNGLFGMVITKIDIFDDFDEIKICTAYKDTRNGKIYNNYPTNTYMHKYLEPVYETMQGWNEKTTDIREYDKLPENVKVYIKRLEELIETPITAISVGPNRDETIVIKNPFDN